VLAKKKHDLNAKPNLTKNTYVTLYLRVGEPTQLTQVEPVVSRIKNQPVLKFVKIFQPNPTQTCGEPGWLVGSNPF